jgi:membrane protease subunit HflC
MKSHGWTIVLVIVVVVLLLLYTVAFTVDSRQIGVVKTFGKAGPPIDGATQAGLHWKWPIPFQSVTLYDAREHFFEDTYEQIQTADRLNVILTVFCTWKIQDMKTFLPFGTEEAVQAQLRDLVRTVKARIVGAHALEDFVNVDAGMMKLAEIQAQMLEAVRPAALSQYGVDVVALGIKMQGLPKSVTEKVMESKIAERKSEAEAYRSMGDSVAVAIRSRADYAEKQIMAFADNKAKLIRGEGERQAAQYLKTFEKNKQLAIFLRELDFLRETLRDNTTFLLDPSMERSFGFFANGPSLGDDAKAATTRPAEEKR